MGSSRSAGCCRSPGDNPERLRSEASFAALCGSSPVPASSGKTIRHRLNRGGDRAANSALHIIAIGRLRTDPATKAYVARRIAEGHSKLDAIRALKRYIAREVFHIITPRYKEINQTRIAAPQTEGPQGVLICQHPLHRAFGGSRHRTFRRQCRRQLRQRAGLDDQRPLQGRSHPSPWTVAQLRSSRVRHVDLGRLVQ